MTLTNDPPADAAPDGPGSPASPDRRPDGQRDTLIAELVDEMTAWRPRDRIDAFRAWLKGSLSLIHLHVLTILEEEGALSMSHLAELLDVSVASATGIVSRMEERGLVERHHGEVDRRVVLVRVTPTGIAVFRDMSGRRRARLSSLLGRLGDDELAGLLTGLRAMRAARATVHAELQARETADDPPAQADDPLAVAPATPAAPTIPAKGAVAG